MTSDDIIDRFALADSDLPRAEILWARDHWAEAGPALAGLLASYVSGADLSERTERALFHAIHLLAEQGEAASGPPLLRLLTDPQAAELVLGDALTTTLPGLLIGTFGGDPAPLLALAEQDSGDEAIRDAALLALAWLTRSGRIPHETMRAELLRLHAEMQPRGPNLAWVGWVGAVAHLGYADLAGRAEGLLREGFVAPDIMGREHFWEDLRRTQADPAGLAGFEHAGVGPLTDCIAALEDWFSPEEAVAPQMPYLNPLKAVGRNDPCPCGSGRKYKKCCLA